MPTRLLIVEPNLDLRERLISRTETLALVDCDADFSTARARLMADHYDWVVTNIRLRAYNGLHLLHLAAAARLSTRILVYGNPCDAQVAREAQLAGAFYELQRSVHRALPAYLQGLLPAGDRRDAQHQDRRQMFRGGRRTSDRQGSGWPEARPPATASIPGRH
jgi:DNA-binding NtrC family response regulator